MEEEEKKAVEEEEKRKGGGLSRREFLKDASLLVGGAAAGAVINAVAAPAKEVTREVVKQAPTTVPVAAKPTTAPGVAPVTAGVAPAFEPEETFISSTEVTGAFDVKNGRIIRGRPLHYDSKYPDLKSWTLTARGKTWKAPMQSAVPAYILAYRKRQDSPNRVLYPLKRVDWEPGGDPAKTNPQNRGISKYKRISWDEAATIIANELKRTADKYGPEAISTVSSGGHGERHIVPGYHGTQTAMLNYWAVAKYGGRTITEGQGRATTNAGGQLGGRYVQGEDYEPFTSHIKDIADNAKMLLGWGADVETSYWFRGIGTIQGMLYRWFGDLGIKHIAIGPDLNVGAANYADKWIPVIPSTDNALMLAIAYTWIKEDKYQKQYVDSHTVGFDKWKAYVMGDEDGVPKTPKWAAPLCGIPEYTIKALAREWAAKATSIVYGRCGGGIGRSYYGHNSQRIQLYLLAMQGWGGPGKHQVRGPLEIGDAAKPPNVGAVGANSKIVAAMTKETNKRLSGNDKDRQFIPADDLYDCFNKPPVDYWYDTDAFVKKTYPLAGKSEVHMIWGTSASNSGSRANGHLALKAFRSPKLECFVSQSIWLEDGMVFSDIILPIATQTELYDIDVENDDAYNTLYIEKPAVKPRGEPKSDLEAVMLVAEKLGFADKINEGKTYKQLVEARVREGYDTSGIKDLVSWEDLNKNGYFSQVPDPKWLTVPPPYLGFFNDPVKNPLRTPSGKIEFESKLLLDNFPDDKERPPLARWVRGGPASEGWTHDEDLTSERAKKYPLKMVSNRATWGRHSQHTDIPWTREVSRIKAWDGYSYSPLWINSVDATTRNIKDGDIVRIYNERGSVLGAAVVTERIRPGAIGMEKGGGADSISYTEINRAGNPNCISPAGPQSKRAYGLAHTGYLVEVEKVTGAQMEEWRAKYPDAFKRDYDPAYGPFLSGWVVDEGGAI
jgi:trimethylamine-N-oxide reductase (cytochrome c)